MGFTWLAENARHFDHCLSGAPFSAIVSQEKFRVASTDGSKCTQHESFSESLYKLSSVNCKDITPM